MSKRGNRSRTEARGLALKGLYSWHVNSNDINSIERVILTESISSVSAVDLEYFKQLLHGVPSKITELDLAVEPFLSRSIASVGPIEKTILRIAVYELLHSDTPAKVVIDEAVELAKAYGAVDSHKFINGVLDNLMPK